MWHRTGSAHSFRTAIMTVPSVSLLFYAISTLEGVRWYDGATLGCHSNNFFIELIHGYNKVTLIDSVYSHGEVIVGQIVKIGI